MLRIIRTILALICFLAITALFLDFSGTAASQWGWIVRYQVIPALLSANIIAILILAAVTFLFGRVYCSVLCPLGVM
ncbi:MAG: 4Fe-4S binding protein, partial [Bacteroidales bacterium]|nr:4Fe-4S binding protein [Bacteroidales bacterium]